jgi:hypothetical protein
MSVRTVTYRLAKVKTLTGHDPADPAQQLALHIAVLGARLLDWPAQNPSQPAAGLGKIGLTRRGCQFCGHHHISSVERLDVLAPAAAQIVCGCLGLAVAGEDAFFVAADAHDA